MTAFGDRIRKRRQEKNLGLRETARKLERSASYLSRLESGDEPNPPSEDFIMRLAAVLDEDERDLMALAGRISKDLENYVASTRAVADFLRTAKDLNIGTTDFNKLASKLLKEHKKS